MSEPRRPDYRLKIAVKPHGKWHVVGAGWLSADKLSVSIQLNPGVHLDWKDNISIVLAPEDS